MEANKTATPRMDRIWDSCGDYEKPHKFAKRVYDAGCAIERQNADLVKALLAVRDDLERGITPTLHLPTIRAALAKAGAA